MNILPLYINSKKIRALLVGGGAIAYRKLKLLIEAEVDVTIIASTSTPAVQELIAQHKITYFKRPYEAGDATDYQLVIAATNVTATNELVQKDATQLFCRVDDATLGNVLLPATVRRGDLVLTVSTGGASPGLTKKISKELANQYDTQYAEYVEFLAFVRKKHKGNKELLKAVIDQRFITMTSNQRMEELLTLIEMSN